MLQHLPGTPEARARFQTLVYQALMGEYEAKP
jgi:hypothetical protein